MVNAGRKKNLKRRNRDSFFKTGCLPLGDGVEGMGLWFCCLTPTLALQLFYLEGANKHLGMCPIV